MDRLYFWSILATHKGSCRGDCTDVGSLDAAAAKGGSAYVSGVESVNTCWPSVIFYFRGLAFDWNLNQSAISAPSRM